MFILTTIADVIQIEPADFTKPSAQALEDNINEKYADKVIQKVGLCICFYDLLSASEGLIGHGEGTVNVKVEFRLIIFRPFKGEIIEGIISESTPAGMRLHVEFFDDITVPPANLFDPSHYEPKEATWIWLSQPDEAADTMTLHFDKNERVRFRVEDELWQDQPPSDSDFLAELPAQVPVATRQGSADGGGVVEGERGKGRKGKVAWGVVASMQQGGLGVLSWW